MFHFDVDLVVGHRERYQCPFFRRVADVRKNLYICHLKTKLDCFYTENKGKNKRIKYLMFQYVK